MRIRLELVFIGYSVIQHENFLFLKLKKLQSKSVLRLSAQ